MKDSMQARCEQFIRSRDRIKETFGWENSYLYPLCAAVFTLHDKEADGDVLKSCVEVLKRCVFQFPQYGKASGSLHYGGQQRTGGRAGQDSAGIRSFEGDLPVLLLSAGSRCGDCTACARKGIRIDCRTDEGAL